MGVVQTAVPVIYVDKTREVEREEEEEEERRRGGEKGEKQVVVIWGGFG